ncbi:MAG: hypothetical protein AB8D52_09790 [Gammaproteobacteria bacterium]
MSSSLLIISGWFLLISTFFSIFNGFFPSILLSISGILSAIAAMILFQKLSGIQRLQVFLLTTTGFLLILTSDENIPFLINKALTANSALIALLISVGFLKLIIKAGDEKEALPTGNKALWKTMFGLQYFAAVINLSAIVLFGDRIKHKNTLHKEQFIILSRNFSAASYWSPFFAAMGVALLYSGGADFNILFSIGVCVSACGLLITGLQCSQIVKKEQREFKGYPMHINSLFLPIILSAQVLIGHKIFPEVSTLILVACIVLITVVVKLIFEHSIPKAFSTIKKHVENGITNSASELLLFLSAGILAVGINALISSMDYKLPIDQFTGVYASLTMIGTVLLALIGIHPVISISIIGSLLVPLLTDPNLLGMMFLFSWGAGVIANPLSGISLVLQSRYNITGFNLIRINATYIMVMLMLCSGVLILYDYLH